MDNTGSENITRAAKKLCSLLEEMAGGLDKLYACLRDQQKALMGWRMADFAETTKRQYALVKDNLDREKQRRELVVSLVGDSRAGDISLRELAENFGGPWPEKFREAAERIRESSSRVAAMKKQNEALIVRCRDLVDGQVKLMLNLATLNRNNYGQSGRKAKQANLHKVLDRQA